MAATSLKATSQKYDLTRWVLPAIFTLALVIRLLILFTAEGYLRSDEAAVGLMAKHIVTKHEFPLFLYGQDYGGGHALVAYIAAPLFALFGMSGTLLTAISMTFGLANLVLITLVLRRNFPRWVGWSAALLYAVAPAAVYGNFLVNGGTEAIFFSLIGLMLFLSDFYAERPRAWRPFAVGVMCGIAYWCMDFTLVYPLMYVVLWAIYRRRRLFENMLVFLWGCLIGATPILYYDLTHSFAHLRRMMPGGGPGGSLIGHAVEAFSSMWAHDLPQFLTVNIDDFLGHAPWDSWAHYLLFLAAVVSCVVWLSRVSKAQIAKSPPSEVIPLVHLTVFCILYSLSKFSLPELRTPRYFLPLYPFFAIIMASGLYRAARGRAAMVIATAIVGLLAIQGIARDSQMMYTERHQEWRTTTSGRAVRELRVFLEARKVYYVWTPYEIQWRLMFESDERITASSAGISRVDRYPDYDLAFRDHAVRGDEPYAVVFDKDFLFAELGRMMTEKQWYEFLRRTGVSFKTAEVGGEFLVFYDFSTNIFRRGNGPM